MYIQKKERLTVKLATNTDIQSNFNFYRHSCCHFPSSIDSQEPRLLDPQADWVAPDLPSPSFPGRRTRWGVKAEGESKSQWEASSATLPCFSFLLRQWDQKRRCCCFTKRVLTATRGGFFCSVQGGRSNTPKR